MNILPDMIKPVDKDMSCSLKQTLYHDKITIVVGSSFQMHVVLFSI